MVEKFEHEIRTLAKFEHEGIVRIYEGGIHTDPKTGETLPFFAAQLVRGGIPITDYAKTHNLTVSERLELFLQVCEAMEAAHQKLVIHRDLKPNNILVDRAGRPFVIDFGLAQVCDPSKRYRGRESVSGTPAYMSPEQVSDAFGPVEQLSDLYTLGVILYELLAGQRPYQVPQQGSWETLREVIITVTPPELSQYHAQCRGDLETIVARTLAKRPTDRYASVAALHRDIRRYLNRVERIEIETAIKLEAVQQPKMTDGLLYRFWQRLQYMSLRKLWLTLSVAILVICMIWWFAPYVNMLRGHLIFQQASHEDDVMRAANVYRTAAESMPGPFWSKQRALIFNRLGRIYAARRFSRYAMGFYQKALKEHSRIAVIHVNKAFLLEEIAEQKAHRFGDIESFKEVQSLYEKALRLDVQDPFTKALRDGLPRRIRMALDRGQVENLLSAPQACKQHRNLDHGSASDPLTIAFHTTQRNGSFASRAGEGEVLLQRLIQALQEHGSVAVRLRALEDDCFAVRLLATYRINRSPKALIHKQTLHISFMETDTGESRIEEKIEWTHDELDGIAEQFASHLIQQLSQSYPSRQPERKVQGGSQP